MASTVIKRITDKAERLYSVRREIEAKEEEHKKSVESLKIERDALQASLLDELKKNELSSIKVSSGDSFTKAVRKGLNITDERKALMWAKERNAVSIDKIRAAAMLKEAKELPEGFEYAETEYISVRKGKSNDE
jgi:hypothetical protein